MTKQEKDQRARRILEKNASRHAAYMAGVRLEERRAELAAKGLLPKPLPTPEEESRRTDRIAGSVYAASLAVSVACPALIPVSGLVGLVSAVFLFGNAVGSGDGIVDTPGERAW